MLDNMKDKTFLLICTVRYALGRQSMAVAWINDLLKKHWKNIPRNDRKIILGDIKSAMNNERLTTLDRMIWEEILTLGVKDGLIVERKNGKYL